MSPLRAMSVVAATILAAVLTSSAASPGVRPGTQSGATVVKTGWWWAANDPAVETGVAASPQPPSPNVPKGSLPVAATAGDPDKVSAIELAIPARPGSYVESAVMVLRESEDPKANVNLDGAAVVACPVTEAFWSDGEAAVWKSRPEYDCEVAQAAGVRDETGVWTFDLTAIAATWSAAKSASPSVVLVEGVDAPVSFQVAYDGPAAKGIGVKVETATVPPAGAGLGAPPASGTSSPTSLGAAGSGGGFGAAPPGGAGLSGVGSVAPPAAPPAGEVPAAQAAPAAAPATAETQPVAAAVTAPPWYSGIPAGGWALLVFALALSYLAMLALGPNAQPVPAGSNRNGVSRVLDGLRRAKAGVAGRITG